VHSIDNAFQVEFDRAGRYLVTVSLADKVVYLLDAVTLKVPADLAPISGRASARALSHPTEPLLLTDGTCFDYDASLGFRALQLFDTEEGREIGIGLKLDCAFWFPDGKSFMGKDDTSIQIWDTDPERWVEAACHFAGRNLSTSEWQRYGPKASYRETCP
jgi:WD40 repeat protein